MSAGGHLALDELLAYWLHETDSGTTGLVEQHLMACDACGEQIDELAALAQGVRAAVRAGAVGAVASAAFVQRLGAQGLRVREYRVERNGSVICSVAPDDDVLVARLAAPLAGVQRLDVLVEWSVEPGVQHRLEDIPFDPQAAELVFLPRLSLVRQHPRHVARLVLLAVEPAGGTRELGSYTFRHGG